MQGPGEAHDVSEVRNSEWGKGDLTPDVIVPGAGVTHFDLSPPKLIYVIFIVSKSHLLT